MATLKQELVAKKVASMVVNGGGGSKKEMLKKIGYSDAIAKNPQKIINSTAVQELIEKYLPTDELLDHVAAVYKSNKGDPSSVPAMRLAADIKGLTKKDEPPSQPLFNVVNINVKE